MHALAITDQGLEWAVALEIKEKFGVRTPSDDTVVKFKVKNYLDLCKFTYTTQASRRVILYIGDYSLKNFECVCDDSAKILKKFDFSEFFDKKTTFKVVCERKGEHDFTARDVEEEVGGIVIDNLEKLGLKPKVSLENPDVIIYCHIHEKKGYIGIDFSGRDLSKRKYKLFSNTSAVRGNLAYSLIRMTKGKKILDPFTGAGIIPLEAAYFLSGKPIQNLDQELAFKKLLPLKGTDWNNFFKEKEKKVKDIYGFDNTLRNIKSADKNSKLAGFDLNFSKTGVDYLDTKFGDKELDAIVTYPPQSSKRVEAKKVEKIYDEFLYQARYVLKGDLIVLMINEKGFLEIAKKHGFKLKEKREIKVGEINYKALKLVKAKA